MCSEPEQTPTEPYEPGDDSTVPVSDRATSGSSATEPDPSRPDIDPTTTVRSVTVLAAAEALGITVEAVRARIKRGTLSKEKASNGTVYVQLSADQIRPGYDRAGEWSSSEGVRTSGKFGQKDRMHDRSSADNALIESLREQIEVLRSELEDRKEEARRKDAIIMSFTQRFPELPPAPPREAPDTPGTREGSPTREAQESQEEPRRRSWFVRFFYGP